MDKGVSYIAIMKKDKSHYTHIDSYDVGGSDLVTLFHLMNKIYESSDALDKAITRMEKAILKYSKEADRVPQFRKGVKVTTNRVSAENEKRILEKYIRRIKGILKDLEEEFL